MKCLECEKEMKAITNTHLKQHCMTVNMYKEKYNVTSTQDESILQHKRDLRLGKTYLDLFGEEITNSIRKKKSIKTSITLTGRPSPKKGKSLDEQVGSKRASELKLEHSIRMRGINNPNYIASKQHIYGPGFSPFVKKQVLQRDNYTCEYCKTRGGRLDIHHIDYDKENNDMNNLITLCHKHHNWTLHKREYWKEFYAQRMKERSLVEA